MSRLTAISSRSMSWPKTSTRPRVERQQRADEADERGLARHRWRRGSRRSRRARRASTRRRRRSRACLLRPSLKRLVTWSMSNAVEPSAQGRAVVIEGCGVGGATGSGVVGGTIEGRGSVLMTMGHLLVVSRNADGPCFTGEARESWLSMPGVTRASKKPGGPSDPPARSTGAQAPGGSTKGTDLPHPRRQWAHSAAAEGQRCW